MNFFYHLKKSPDKLFILVAVLMLLAFVFQNFPVLIFVAFAPLFACLDNPAGLRGSYRPFIVAILAVLVFAYYLQQYRIISWVIYFALLAFIILMYLGMQQFTKNRLNKFGLIFFVLGMEYLMLKFIVHHGPVFLADLLADKTSWTKWNIFTGYTGATLWILLTNLLFYQGLFAKEKLNWILLSLGILLIVLPIVYSLNLTNHTLTKIDVIRFYSVDEGIDSPYSQHGELISRTGAWVSVLIIIFTLIKGTTKKVLR